jgi:hypothetical protein
VLTEIVGHACGQSVAQCGFDLTSRDADVSERAIVERMELADGTAQKPSIGQVARQPSAPRAESAEPLRQPAHGAAHAGFDNETVETGLPLGLQEQGRGQGIISLEHGGSAGGRFSQQGRKFSGTNEDVLGRETEARKLFIVELSEPRPYALLDPEQACAAGSIWPGARPCLGAKNWMVIDSLLISLQRRPTSGLAHQPDAGSRLDPS